MDARVQPEPEGAREYQLVVPPAMIWPRIKSPKFYLSFTILVSFILVKYPDRIGLVNTVQAGTGTVP